MRKAKLLLSKVLVIAMILGLVAGAGMITAEPVQAQSALGANWVVAVTYQNLGDAATPVTVNFYPEGSATATPFDPRSGKGDLAAGAADSFFIGTVSNLPAGFRGSAVMSANEPLAATIVQFSQDAGFKMRLLSNAFDGRDSVVSNQYLVATTLLNKFDRTTLFSVQNTTSDTIDATVKFYDADDNGNLKSEKVFNIPANSAEFISMDNFAETGISDSVFNGSAIVTAVKSGTSEAATVVASASEYFTNIPVATAFEGVPLSAAANTSFMATALCERFNLDTFYAIQNASLTDNATITVTYKNTDGSTKSTDGPYVIGGGQKKSVNSCKPSDGTNMSNFSGAAVITSTGAPIVAIGKAQNSINAGSAATSLVLTAFLGQKEGYSTLALPFVRWASDASFNDAGNTGGKQRAFIAIQNLENSAIKVNVKYNDKNGATVATQTLDIAANSKGNTNPNAAGALGLSGMNAGEFGYYTDNSFGGGVIIEADSSNANAKFIAIARVQHPGAGEDYNGVEVQ